jgi:glycosyltransferase involved in cell wall biosynthesis
MKVLRIIPSMNPASGGPCQGIRNIIPELKKEGVENEVVCLDDPGEAFLGKDGFKIYPLGPTKTPWQYSPKLVPWLQENLGKYDLVILHALWLYHGYALLKVIKRLKAAGIQVPKFYVMPHGMLDPYFQQAGERKLKAARNWLYWKLIESKVVHEADGVLFTCESELLLARKPFRPYHPKKEINIGYGVQPPPVLKAGMEPAFKAKCPGLDDQPYFLFLSRIHEKKGIDHLVEAYSTLLDKYPGTDGARAPLPKLVIAGPGLDTVYGKQIQGMATTANALSKSIFFPGMLLGNEKWGAFYGCTAFILPSHQENFGIAVAEALSCGKPVLISYQVNIWREIVENGAGIAADDSSPGAELLMDAWMKLSAHSKTSMQEKALKCFQEEFAISTAADRFCKLLLN